MAASCDRGDGAVQIEIAFRAGQRMGADVEVRDGLCAPACGINGKSARKTEGVQNGSTLSETCNLAAIFPMIKKETGFLSANDICFESESGFVKNDWRGRRLAAQNLTIVHFRGCFH